MLREGLVGGAVVGAAFATLFIFVTVMNADMYGRLIETKVASGVGEIYALKQWSYCAPRITSIA